MYGNGTPGRIVGKFVLVLILVLGMWMVVVVVVVVLVILIVGRDAMRRGRVDLSSRSVTQIDSRVPHCRKG